MKATFKRDAVKYSLKKCGCCVRRSDPSITSILKDNSLLNFSQQTSIANYEIEETEVVVAWDVASNSALFQLNPRPLTHSLLWLKS